jgi:P4 family phage/plasmid primase-like protien
MLCQFATPYARCGCGVSGLSVPVIPDGADLIKAALLYAGAGWYIGPTAHRDKNPGMILGKGWQHQTSRDPDQIVAWFAGTSAAGIFLHVGRSGALIFDVDRPELVGALLAAILWENPEDPVEDRVARVPYQSTRKDRPGRGHYLVLQPEGRLLGNSAGTLGDEWGEVRGLNGVIIVEPSEHEADDGQYIWQVAGPVPACPPELSEALPDSSKVVDAASDERVEAFLTKHVGNDKPGLSKPVLADWDTAVNGGASRHHSTLKAAIRISRDAVCGFYPARPVMVELWKRFHDAIDGTPGRYPRPEFAGMLAWSVAQAEDMDAGQRRLERDAALKKRDDEKDRAKKAQAGSQAGAAAPAVAASGTGIDPESYFRDKTLGLNVTMLANDVLDMGPLALGRDGNFWEYADGVWRSNKKVVRRRCVALLGERFRQSHASNCEEVVESRVPEIHCDPVEGYFNCLNGMVNWRTGKIEPHDPGYFSTVQFPWNWTGDPTCPKFDKFLEEALTGDFRRLCWQMIGYALYSGNPRQRAFLLHGEGGEGKGTLLRVLTAMLGSQNIATESLTSLNTSRFSAINLFGKIGNIAGDIEAAFQTETNIFKAVTGQDYIGAEHKYGQRFNFCSWALPIFSCNKIPGSADTSKGYLRRWMMLKFQRPIRSDEVIIDYSDQMLPEIAGIAAKALPFLREVMESGFFEGGEIAEAADEFALAVDQARQWLQEATIPAADHSEDRTGAYKSYRAWAQENGVGPLKASEFYVRLTQAGHPTVKVRGVRMIRGFRIMDLVMKGSSYEADGSDPWVDNSSSSDG